MSELTEAYNRTDFEVIDHGNLSLPTSTPAVFTFDSGALPITAETLESLIENGDYQLIAPYSETSDSGRVYLSSKVYAVDTNEFFHVKITSTHISIFPKDADFSQKTFEAFIDHITSVIDTSISLMHYDS